MVAPFTKKILACSRYHWPDPPTKTQQSVSTDGGFALLSEGREHAGTERLAVKRTGKSRGLARGPRGTAGGASASRGGRGHARAADREKNEGSAEGNGEEKTKKRGEKNEENERKNSSSPGGRGPRRVAGVSRARILNKKTNKRPARVAFVARGTGAITCQFCHWYPRVPPTVSGNGGLSLFLCQARLPRKKEGGRRGPGTNGVYITGVSGSATPCYLVG